jgi:O-antigen/teichoic acid export membrane protein
MKPAALILGATVISGGTGYLVTALVAAVVDVADYTVFAVAWSALFLIVGALGGVQHELTRAASPLPASPLPGADSVGDARAGRARASVFAAAVAGLVAALLAATAPLWAPPLLGDLAVTGALALIVGAVGYVLVAAVCGVLYGIEAWRPLAVMIALDGVLRLALVGIALAVGAPTALLLWAVAVPFALTLLLVVPVIARRLRRSQLDVGFGRLSANTARTVVAAAATAALIAGFPALLRATDPLAPEAVVGPLVLVLTLTRAPLVIPVMAMQSYLVVRLRAEPQGAGRRTAQLVALVLLVAALAAALLALVGPGLFAALFGPAYALDGAVIAGLVASAGFVAGLAITGPALLARERHSAVTAGWVVAVAVLLAVLLLPLPLTERALLALAAGPAVGLVVHAIALRSRPPKIGGAPSAPADAPPPGTETTP